MRIRLPSFVVLRALAGLILLTIAETGLSSGAEPGSSEVRRLLDQPRADYQARRRSLMQQVKDMEAKHVEEMRAALQKRMPDSAGEFSIEPVIVLVGQDDSNLQFFEGKYRQKNEFAYLTGVEAPAAGLILLPNQDREILYLPLVNRTAAPFEEVPDGPGPESAEKFGFARVESTETFLADLFRAISDPRKMSRAHTRSAVVYTLAPGGVVASLGSDARFANFIREGAPTTQVKDLSPLLGEMRKAKSCAEIALLQKAIDITGAAQREVVAAIGPCVFEYELDAKILETFTRLGAQRAGFPSIVGSGPNSTIPHYFTNRRKLEDGDLVVIDIGAEYNYYTADITRTYPASGKFTPRQREIYQLVLDAQKAAEEHVKPGETKLSEMTHWMREYLKQSPLRARDRDGSEHSMEHFFIHGLGHYLGMDVHDVGETSKPLQPGEVFTIEPGIYISSENLGVRLEDDYLITEQGLEKLSKAIPSELDEVERLIAEARLKASPAVGSRAR